MTLAEALAKLNELLALPTEHECVEFKHAKTNYDSDKLGQYFSALSNEANLQAEECSWFVMGVDKDHNVLGTEYRSQGASLQRIKHEIAVHTALGLTFTQIHTVRYGPKKLRVLMFQVPAAPHGVPMSWKGHFYGRDGESIGALRQNEYDAIRAQSAQDWSATACSGATPSDLEPAAIAKARDGFKIKNPELSSECDAWSDATFLSKAKLTRGGKVTFAALLLLGRSESAHFLAPADASIFWVRKRADGTDAEHRSFGPPYVLSVDGLFGRVRNERHQFMRDGTLFPIDILQYDPWVIREMLHNAIAHQDYRQSRRVNVVEREGALSFTNAGSFQPGSVEKVVEENRPQDRFRNLCLVEGMRSINMIETLGSGIPRVYRLQKQRGFPMTDYDFSDPRSVAVKVYGEVLDENYTRALLAMPEIEIRDAIALDKVQKGLKLDASAFGRLRDRKLVEGTRTKARIAAHVPGASLSLDQIAEAILALLRDGEAKTAAITGSIMRRLPNSMGEVQKANKVRNALQLLARENRIRNVGKAGRGAIWKLLE